MASDLVKQANDILARRDAGLTHLPENPWEVMRALVARIEELERAQAWRPIESAPKDGTTIYGENWKTGDRGLVHFADDGRWELVDGLTNFPAGKFFAPTHWMPPPLTPALPGESPAQPFDPARSPSMTDLMVTPESLDDWSDMMATSISDNGGEARECRGRALHISGAPVMPTSGPLHLLREADKLNREYSDLLAKVREALEKERRDNPSADEYVDGWNEAMAAAIRLLDRAEAARGETGKEG